MQALPHHGEHWFKDVGEQAEQARRADQLKATIRTLTEQTSRVGLPLGETGQYPQGAMTPDDEGELRLAVTTQAGKVILAFGKPIAWLGMSPREARQMADALNEWAAKA